MAEPFRDALLSSEYSHAPQSPTTQRLLLRAAAAAKRRRRRLLSASENGAIVEHDHINASVTSGDVPVRRIPLPPRHTITRRRLLDCYGKEPLHARQRIAFRRASRDEYNYNWFVPVEIDKAAEEAASSPKKMRRLRNALLLGRLSLDELREGTRGVFDSGHIDSPISRLLRRHAEKSSAEPLPSTTTKKVELSEACGSTGSIEEEIDENTVLLINPVFSEIPSRAQMELEESLRVAPKGREWDRQHALRHGVGPTAQEALIDCRIDPRYRKPGDYVRRNYRGEVVDARGRPMHVGVTSKCQ